MADLFAYLEESMLAATFAEAGEHDMAKAQMGAGKTARKKVLFGAQATELPPRIIRQAVEICKRNGAGLEILHVLPAETAAAVEQRSEKKTGMAAHLARLKKRLMGLGILYEVVFGDASLEEAIIRHAAGRRDIMLVVMGKENRTGKRGGKSASHLLKRLHCPVVLLEEPRPA